MHKFCLIHCTNVPTNSPRIYANTVLKCWFVNVTSPIQCYRDRLEEQGFLGGVRDRKTESTEEQGPSNRRVIIKTRMNEGGSTGGSLLSFSDEVIPISNTWLPTVICVTIHQVSPVQQMSPRAMKQVSLCLFHSLSFRHETQLLLYSSEA